MKKEKTGKSRLLRRYVVSLVVFMLVLILVLSTVTASIIRESLMNMWHDFAFTAVGALVNDSFRAMVEYHERGSVEEELLLSTFVEIEVMQVDWNLINCYIAIPEEDGLRYVFGAGELVRDIPAEEWNGLLLNWKEPYREGMEAWLKTIIEAETQNWMATFAMGVTDLDSDWDTYVETLNQYGLERYLELYQQIYDVNHQ